MPWLGVSLQVVFPVVVVLLGPLAVFADGNVGCLFSDRLCQEDEWCFDDYAFGRCLPPSAGDDQQLYRFSLEKEILHLINRELQRLFTLGYRWSHAYTQCRLQTLLYAIKLDIPFDTNSCSHLVDQDLQGALKAMEGGAAPLDPHEMAIIKYTPSIDDPHAEYADEIYYPPIENNMQAIRETILPSNAVDILDMQDPYAEYEMRKRAWIPQMHRRSLSPPPDVLEFLDQNRDQDEYVKKPEKFQPFDVIIPYYDGYSVPSDENVDEMGYESRLRDLLETIGSNAHVSAEERFTPSYNTPDGFRAGWETKDYADSNTLPESRIYFDEASDNNNEEENGSGASNARSEIFRELKTMQDNNEIFRELKNKNQENLQNALYTEGGVVYMQNDKDDEDTEGALEDLGQVLSGRSLEFKRPERLDVKKPGPPFDVSIKGAAELLMPAMMKKEPRGAHPNPAHDFYSVDTEYVYVEFKNSIKTWAQGEGIIRSISTLLHLEPTVFTYGQVDRNEVMFKVSPNSLGLNSTEVARKIDQIKDQLMESTGFEVTAVGVGDRTSRQTVVASVMAVENGFYPMVFLISGITGAAILAGALLIMIRKTIKSREKLQQLARPDTEASKDYQDLCRARMATKGQAAEGAAQQGRITSLSRESEQSPSSRSSTSSWSEEPALHNMDISTGHMVLSYMEDHLKNKDRLEQEWVALCAYVAEPCETTVALRQENVDKNRYKDIVPYDHARVVLNELSNAAGNDYINASSITDHDPRNPAYIATQGPLPATSPDFWQLIWEQGAVVIVMLTRLTEGGTAMCHRYWPEEGSELYHIYEVHLVSEHIWCDDYLVRSFYLKNLRTGETRTVTQFHFLSWAESCVPASTKALLEFRRKVNKSYRGRSCPIVVHCSDGAGRTGTYCLIDMVLSRMAKGAKEIDIAATLEHLRDQRPRMVASKQQFEFVLTAVAEEVHAILKALPPQPAAPTAADKP